MTVFFILAAATYFALGFVSYHYEDLAKSIDPSYAKALFPGEMERFFRRVCPINLATLFFRPPPPALASKITLVRWLASIYLASFIGLLFAVTIDIG